MTVLDMWKRCLDLEGSRYLRAEGICFYCHRKTMATENDHFPFHKASGGYKDQAVTACLFCHDLKDRVDANIRKNYLLGRAQDWNGKINLTVEESLFLFGRLSIICEFTLENFFWDFSYYPEPLAIWIAEMIREQVCSMTGTPSYSNGVFTETLAELWDLTWKSSQSPDYLEAYEEHNLVREAKWTPYLREHEARELR